MIKQKSFTMIEKELLHKMREKINNAEDKIDLENHFSMAMAELINKASNHTLTAKVYDVTFEPNDENCFKVCPELMQNEQFQTIWNESDLPNVIDRFARSVNRRFIHLEKHTEKTNKKIRSA